MAYLNIAHYQQWSDYATSIHMSNVPFLAAYGDALGLNPAETRDLREGRFEIRFGDYDWRLNDR